MYGILKHLTYGGGSCGVVGQTQMSNGLDASL